MTSAFRMTVAATLLIAAGPASPQVAVHGDIVHTAAGTALADTVIVIEAGRITRIGPAADVEIPAGFRTLHARVVTPGLIDAHCTIGLSGYLNQPHDQDQTEESEPMQPELRAIDAYNPLEALVSWARSYGVTTVHTGHSPEALISGQTAILKLRGGTVEEGLVKSTAMIAVTLGDGAREETQKSPGTRSKMASMLRAELLRASEYMTKGSLKEGERQERSLRMEALGRVIQGQTPLLVTAQRAQDIVTALRIRDEFDIPIILDGVAEAPAVLDRIRDSGVPVIVHPTMMRARGETENLSFETAAKLYAAGVPAAIQGGYEGYVPKSRLVLFEAGVAAAHGLGFDNAIRSITINAARILGIDDRVGSIEIGKDGDLALYDGDPFEYTSHCIGVVIDGVVISEDSR